MKNRNDWQHTKEELQGFPCVKHQITKELTIAGAAGEIWQYSDTEMAMIIRSGGRVSNILKVLGIKKSIDARSELLVRFNPTLLTPIILAARIDLFPGEQLFWANR